MKTFIDNLVSHEIVDVVVGDDWFAMLFDNGTILVVNDTSNVTFTDGDGWEYTWDKIKASAYQV